MATHRLRLTDEDLTLIAAALRKLSPIVSDERAYRRARWTQRTKWGPVLNLLNRLTSPRPGRPWQRY